MKEPFGGVKGKVSKKKGHSKIINNVKPKLQATLDNWGVMQVQLTLLQ